MARESITRRSVRSQPQERERPAAPELGVHMQLFGGGAPSKSAHALAGLASALGVVSDGLEYFGKKQKADDYEQGKADSALGQVDEAKKTRSESYAQGVFETATLSQYQSAEAAVAARVAEELDHSLPVNEQVAQVDSWMKEEMADLVADPHARRLIAKRYQSYIEQFGGEVVSAQTKARAESALTVARDDVFSSIERTGTFDYSETHQRLSAVLGDGSAATKAVMNIIGERIVDVASKGGDWQSVRAMIPTSIKTADGRELPSPLRSQSNREIIERAEAKAKTEYGNFMDPAVAQAGTHLRMSLDDMLRNNQRIYPNDVAAIGPDGKPLLSPDAQASYVDQSMKGLMRAADAEAEQLELEHAITKAGGWRAAIGTPNGPKSMDEVQAYANGAYQKYLAGFDQSGTLNNAPALIENPEALGGVLAISSMERVPYEPLSQYMRSITSAAPGSVLQRLNAYQAMKQKGDGVLGMYLDDETHALYETAIDYGQSGADEKAVMEFLRRSGDADTQSYVSNELPKLKMRDQKFEARAVGDYFSTDSNELANRGYVQGRLESLARVGLSKHSSPEAARTFAVQRFKETHTVIAVGNAKYAFPNSEVNDPQEAAKALEWWASEAPNVAKRRGVPEFQAATFVPSIGINSRRIEFELRDEIGVPVPGSKPITIDEAIRVYRVVHPKDVRAEVEAAHQKRQQEEATRREALKRQQEEMLRNPIKGGMRMQ